MPKQITTVEIMEYMVWIVEIVSSEFFNSDKTVAYKALKDSGLWDIYVDHYDTTHSLGRECLVDEIGGYFSQHEVSTSC